MPRGGGDGVLREGVVINLQCCKCARVVQEPPGRADIWEFAREQQARGWGFVSGRAFCPQCLRGYARRRELDIAKVQKLAKKRALTAEEERLVLGVLWSIHAWLRIKYLEGRMM